MENGNPVGAPSGILFSENGEKLLHFPRDYDGEYEIPSGVKEIDGGAFKGCTKLRRVKFPPGVEKIWHAAFEGCSSLEAVVLPTSLKDIYQFAFRECVKLRRIEAHSDIYLGSQVFPTADVFFFHANGKVKSVQRYLRGNLCDLAYGTPARIDYCEDENVVGGWSSKHGKLSAAPARKIVEDVEKVARVARVEALLDKYKNAPPTVAGMPLPNEET